MSERFDFYKKKCLVDIVTGLQPLHYFDLCHVDLEAENFMIISGMKVVISNFSYTNKNSNHGRRHGVKTCRGSLEEGKVNGHNPPCG